MGGLFRGLRDLEGETVGAEEDEAGGVDLDGKASGFRGGGLDGDLALIQRSGGRHASASSDVLAAPWARNGGAGRRRGHFLTTAGSLMFRRECNSDSKRVRNSSRFLPFRN